MAVADTSFDPVAFRRGIKAALPLVVPPIPFGLALGLVVRDSEVVGNFVGWASSWILFAGSAQLVAVQLLDEGASIAVIVLGLAMINARHVVYSAVISQRIGSVPGWFRVVGSYWLTDQVFAIDEMQPEAITTRQRMWMMLGAGATFWTVWQTIVLLGIVAGGYLPDDFPVGFTVAVLFAGLMVLSIKNRPGVVAAVVGGIVVIATRGLPPGTGVVIALLAGAAAGAWAERLLEAR